MRLVLHSRHFAQLRQHPYGTDQTQPNRLGPHFISLVDAGIE